MIELIREFILARLKISLFEKNHYMHYLVRNLLWNVKFGYAENKSLNK